MAKEMQAFIDQKLLDVLTLVVLAAAKHAIIGQQIRGDNDGVVVEKDGEAILVAREKLKAANDRATVGRLYNAAKRARAVMSRDFVQLLEQRAADEIEASATKDAHRA